MTTIVDETYLREPNLWVPGKKPIGPVKIDWEHPYTKGLVAAYIFQVKDGNNAIDLVKGSITKLHSSTPMAIEGVNFTSPTNVTDLPAPLEIAGNDKFTFMFRARSTTGVAKSVRVLFSYRDGTSTSGVFICYPWDSASGPGIRVFYDGVTKLDENLGAVHFNTNPNTFSVVGRIGSDALTGYVNNNKTIAGEIGVAALTSTPTALSIGGWNGTTQLTTDVYLHHLYVFDHNVEEAQIRDMHRDPYQILTP